MNMTYTARTFFAGIRVKGSGASKTDRLPITEEQLEGASQDFLNDPLAAALFVTPWCLTSAPLGQI